MLNHCFCFKNKPLDISLIVFSYPISPELDAERGHLAFQALESYGPCLQISDNEETELYNLTDGFSVAALKVKIN